MPCGPTSGCGEGGSQRGCRIPEGSNRAVWAQGTIAPALTEYSEEAGVRFIGKSFCVAKEDADLRGWIQVVRGEGELFPFRLMS